MCYSCSFFFHGMTQILTNALIGVQGGSWKNQQTNCFQSLLVLWCSKIHSAGSWELHQNDLMLYLTTCSSPAAVGNKRCVCCHFGVRAVWCSFIDPGLAYLEKISLCPHLHASQRVWEFCRRPANDVKTHATTTKKKNGGSSLFHLHSSRSAARPGEKKRPSCHSVK